MKTGVKKLIGVIIGLILVTGGITAYGYTEKAIKVVANSDKIVLNGSLVVADNFSYQNTTYVQLRTICEMLNKVPVWDGSTRTINIVGSIEEVSLTKQVISLAGAKTIKVLVNTVKVTVEGKPVTADNFGYNGYTYVKLRDMCNLLGKDISWEQATKTIYIDNRPVMTPIISQDEKLPTNRNVTVTVNNWGTAESREYKVGDGGWQTYLQPVAIEENCKVYARGTDQYGNMSSVAEINITNIDKVAPAKPEVITGSMEKTRDKLLVTIDKWDGAAVKEYKIDDNEWKTYTNPFILESNGTISARGRDAAGNNSEIAVYTVSNIVNKKNIQQIAEQSKAVVLLKTYSYLNEETGSASGFIVSADGKVVTNYHVIDYAFRIEAYTADNKKYEVKGILGYDKEKDLALIQLENASDLPVVDIGNSEDLKLGEEIVAIGSPLGLKNTVSNGIVSSLRAGLFREGGIDIQISAPISEGSSGGALFNMYGEVVGITYAGEVSGQNLNYAIPVNEIKPMLSSNALTPLIDVINKEYPYFDITKTVYEKFNSFKIFNYTFQFDVIRIVEDEEDSNQLNIYLTLFNESFLTIIDATEAGYTALAEQWLGKIMEEVRKKYPGKEVSAGIWYEAYSDYNPTDVPSKYVTYDSVEKIWYIEMFVLFGTRADGQYEYYWLP